MHEVGFSAVFLVWLVPFRVFLFLPLSSSFFLFLRVCFSSPGRLFGFVCFVSLVAFAPGAPYSPCVFWVTWYGFPRRLLPPLLPPVSVGV